MKTKNTRFRLGWLLWIIVLLPYSLIAQTQNIAFNSQGFNFKSSKEEAPTFLNKFLHLPDGFSFRLIDKSTIIEQNGETHYTYQQYYSDYPIQNATIKIHCENSEIYFINGDYIDSIDAILLDIKISEDEAFNTSLTTINAKEYAWENPRRFSWLEDAINDKSVFNFPIKPTLVFFDDGLKEKKSIHLVYRFDIVATDPFSNHSVFVDAQSGLIVSKLEKSSAVLGTADTRYSGTQDITTSTNGTNFTLVDASRNISTKDANNGMVPFTDNNNDWTSAEFDNAAKDNAALDAHWGAEMTFDYFSTVHNRTSFDGSGGAINCLVHFCGILNCGNALWLGGGSLAFGDGLGGADVLTSIDFVAHEYGHAINGATAQLVHLNESGAIDEGISDIWGACVENFTISGKETWTIGEDVTSSGGIPGGGIRFLDNPNSSSEGRQPDTYGGTNWINTTGCTPDGNNDFCGVHTNSGVICFWFYLLSEGGSGTNDISNAYAVSGIGIEDAARIIYRAETVYMTSLTNYASARSLTIKAAQDIFGYCSPEVVSTINAWHAVGIGNSFEAIGNIPKTTTILNGSTEDIYAHNILTASNIIQTGTNVSYTASGAIKLEPGFSTALGTNFVAEIIPCKDLSSKKEFEQTSVYSKFKKLPQQDFGFAIYPNPANDFFTVKLSENNKLTELSIFDINSKLIKNQKLISDQTLIYISDLSSGVYILLIKATGTCKTYKLVKK